MMDPGIEYPDVFLPLAVRERSCQALMRLGSLIMRRPEIDPLEAHVMPREDLVTLRREHVSWMAELTSLGLEMRGGLRRV